MNDQDREEWVDNDEGLYRWWRSSELSKREFIKRNRREISEVIDNVLNNRRPAHYLVYPERNR